MSDRLDWIGRPTARWVRNALAVILIPYMLWSFVTDLDSELLVSFGMLVLLFLTFAIKGDQERGGPPKK